MPSWLPLIMPRPELFSDNTLPDLGAADRAELFEGKYGRGWEHSFRMLRRASVAPLRMAERDVEDTSEASDLHHAAKDDFTNSVFISLPLFTWIHVFARGYSRDLYHEDRNPQASKIRATIARSCMTWSVGDAEVPLYRLDRMQWQRSTLKPDLGDLPGETGVQVIIPYDRQWGSAHKRLHLAGHLKEDLALMGAAYGWGEPLEPRRINLPRHMV